MKGRDGLSGYICVGGSLLLLIIIIALVHSKMQHEKLYPLRVFPYFIFSSIFFGWIPFGFLFSVLVIATHDKVINKKFKIIAAILGVLGSLGSIIINEVYDFAPAFLD